MRTLVVGAGAIGRVVALHLARGGAEVCALVKSHQVAAARSGFSVVRRRRIGADELDWVRFADVLTSPSALAMSRWDAVFLCVASPALADRAWLDALAAATRDAAVVVVQPGLDDAARVAAAFGDERVVVGAMSLMAWAGDELADTEYWIPPLATVPLTAATASTARARAVATALTRGGLAARVHADAGAVGAAGAAVLETTAAGLACAGGRRELARDRSLGRLVATAAREALAIVTTPRDACGPHGRDEAHRDGAPMSWLARLFASGAGPFAIDGLLAGLAAIAPVAPDRFFALHYSKLARQSRETLAAWSARATELGLASGALDDLRARLDASRDARGTTHAEARHVA